MTRFNLVEALETTPAKLLNMLADEAATWEQFFSDQAAGYTIGEPDQFGQYDTFRDEGEYYFMCEQKEKARDLLAHLEQAPPTKDVLTSAATALAEYASSVGDFELQDEMVAVAR